MNEPQPSAPRRASLPFTRSIAWRLVVWFLAISLVPCAIFALIVSRSATDALEESVRAGLVQVAASKSGELETYAAERLVDATNFANSSTLRAAMTTLLKADAAGKLPEVAAQAAASISTAERNLGYRQLLLLDVRGRILCASRPGPRIGGSILEGPLAGSELAAGFEAARSQMRMEMTAFAVYPGSTEPLSFVTGPVVDNGTVIGVVAGALGPERFWRLLEDVTGLGETGEVMACQSLGADGIVATAPLRLSKDAPFRLRLREGDPGFAGAATAARGGRGYGILDDYRGQQVVAAWSYMPSYRWGLIVKQDHGEAFATVDAQRRVTLVLGVILVISVVVTALVVARSISEPVHAAFAATRQVSGGDLRVQVGPTGRDETGALLAGIQAMTDDLRSLIGRIKQSSSTLTEAASSMTHANEQQREVVTEHGASTAETVAAINQITATSQELAGAVAEVNTLAAVTGHRADEGRADLGQMNEAMRQLEAATASIDRRLAAISERASGIGTVVTTMVNVANQTNLLSINAAIEAAKAGEHGLGFLVVAREVSRLADQTAAASLEIERMVAEMQASVTAGVREMGAFAGEVRGGAQRIEEVSAKFGEIIGSIQTISGRFCDVAEGMRAQSQGADRIQTAMRRLADGATRTASSIDDSSRALEQLRAAVRALESEVSRFTV